ncbi:hypothetical protein QJS10_CPB11g01203 [Acorus calamus]|uniref:PGG domain-containing protein n=1 Tax=Acorus calamus TaxID=4465 RepID=A0AAV9DSZ8_ACOCL|nr:hypothetical protein QJS10_CPB11g01203 [Acorus calamus]
MAFQLGKDQRDPTTTSTSANTLLARDPAENTALHLALMSGGPDDCHARRLSERHPQLIVTKNLAGNTPLHYALKTERYVTSPKQESNDSLFMHFMGVLEEEKKKDLEIGKRTMRLKANEAGESLLFLAADRGLLNSVKRLLTGRVLESDCTGPNGWTALHAAVFRRNMGIAEELLKCKPELNNIGDASGNTPLHYAVAYHESNMMELMLKSDATASKSIAYHKNVDGHTPLHVAAACGYMSMVKAIADKYPGCVTLTDNQGRTVLHVAVQADHLTVVKHILKHPQFAGLINDRDNDGNTPLHLAALNHNHVMVLFLSTSVRHKMDTNPMNSGGRTPRDILDTKIRYQEGDLKRIFAHYAGIYAPLRVLFIEAGGRHGPRLCDLAKKLKQSGKRRRPATTNKKPKARKDDGDSDLDEEDYDDDGGKGESRTLEKLASNLMLVAILIITVAFAAIITMPGGFESDPGNNTTTTTTNTTNNGYGGTAAFVLTDTLAFLLSFGAASRLIWTALTKGVESLIEDIRFAQGVVQAALVAMTLAFGTGAYCVLAHHCDWIAEVILGIVCVYTLHPFMELLPSLFGKSREALEALGLAYRSGPKSCAKRFPGKDRFPYPVGYHAVRCHAGSTYSMEIHEGLKGPVFVKKSCSRVKNWHGKRFSSKINGGENSFARIDFDLGSNMKEPKSFLVLEIHLYRVLRELVANVNGTAERSSRLSTFCNGTGKKEHETSTAFPKLLPYMCNQHSTGKRSRKYRKSNSTIACGKRFRSCDLVNDAQGETSSQRDETCSRGDGHDIETAQKEYCSSECEITLNEDPLSKNNLQIQCPGMSRTTVVPECESDGMQMTIASSCQNSVVAEAQGTFYQEINLRHI